jgi:sec-independent protein translocase protein TatC
MSVAELTQPVVTAPAEEDEAAGKTMTIMEHLQELRFRLAVSAGAIVVAMIPGWFIAPWVISLLREPVKELGPLHYLNVGGAFILQLKIAAVLGVIFSLPVSLYQAWAFISPGLTKRERRHSLPFIFLGLVLFVAGCYTAYRITPIAINFLLGFTNEDLAPLLVADQYISFVAIILLVFGVAFELPLVLVFLCQLGIISSGWLIQKLRYSIFIIFIVSTIVTPGADFVTPLIMGTIMSGLYLLAIVLAKFIGK